MSESLLPDEGEHLSNGWEADAPADDTLKRRAVLVHASWPVAVASALGRPSRRTGRWSGAWVGDSGDLTNPVVLTQPVPDADAASVVAEVADLVPPTTPYFLLSPWLEAGPRTARPRAHRPPAAHGALPRSGPERTPEGVRVVEVRDADGLAAAERVLIAGYPLPGCAPGSVLQPGLLDGTTRVWLGYVDGEPVSVAAAHHGRRSHARGVRRSAPDRPGPGRRRRRHLGRDPGRPRRAGRPDRQRRRAADVRTDGLPGARALDGLAEAGPQPEASRPARHRSPGSERPRDLRDLVDRDAEPSAARRVPAVARAPKGERSMHRLCADTVDRRTARRDKR